MPAFTAVEVTLGEPCRPTQGFAHPRALLLIPRLRPADVGVGVRLLTCLPRLFAERGRVVPPPLDFVRANRARLVAGLQLVGAAGEGASYRNDNECDSAQRDLSSSRIIIAYRELRKIEP